MERLMNRNEVVRLTRLSDSELTDALAERRFPQPDVVGDGAKDERWWSSGVRQWCEISEEARRKYFIEPHGFELDGQTK